VKTDFGHFILLDEIQRYVVVYKIGKVLIFSFLVVVFCPKNLAIVRKILLCPTQGAAAPSAPPPD